MYCKIHTDDCNHDFFLNAFPSTCVFARRLLNNNELDKIKADGLFEKLPELQHLDLRKNKISRIEASAFQGAHNLTDL